MRKETSNDLESIFERYYSAHRAGNLAEAKAGYLDILEKRPDHGRALNALGNLYLDQDQPEKATPVFEKATRLDPPNLSACYNLGRLKQLGHDHDGAILLYRMMLGHQPDIGLVWNNLGVAYRETGRPDQALESFQAAVRYAPDMAEAWNNLGVAQDEQDQAEQALTSYRKAIEIAPDYPSPHLNLGVSLQKSRQYSQAEKHYAQVLRLQPNNKIAAFLRQSIRGEETPDAAPTDHVRNIFDQCAEHFETILVDKLAYQTPELLFHLVRPYLKEKMTMLDIGCGTGLGAQLYRPYAKRLTGVDVSVKMLEKASQKNVYDHLEAVDILEDWDFPVKFDLIYSADVFVYMGNLYSVIMSAASYLVDGGIIAFSVEKLDDHSAKYRLFPSGRYAHSRGYIQACLERHGLIPREIKDAHIRNQSGDPVKGLLIVAVKK